ncbi:MAG: hypothetical protein J6X65_02665 [Bacteroidales bacterium]|nr:hypothetical protein [Bacteroidales bacterium]
MKTRKTAFILAVSILLFAACEKDPIPTPSKPNNPINQETIDFKECAGKYLISTSLHHNDTLVVSIVDEMDSTLHLDSYKVYRLTEDVTCHADGTFDYYGLDWEGINVCNIITGYFYAQDSVYFKWGRWGSCFWLEDEFYGVRIVDSCNVSNDVRGL